MDNAARLQYLGAMGIDVWVSRHRSIAKPLPAYDEDVSKNAGWVEQSKPHGDSLGGEQSFSDVLVPAPAKSSEQVWIDLKNEVAACHACNLCESRTQTVFGVGNHHARWLLIGEAPGQNEDLQGEPFVGKAGQLLTEMLRAIGLKR
ncbi:MAG: uracil-DNA glycosylase, partial [Methylomonas sp.]|nr:uracil-DNA glycosylase [Methylomonas sp.]